MLVPADVVASAITLLMGVDDAVSDRLPNPRPAVYTRITDGGGDQRNLVQGDFRLIVECWADTNIAARDRAGFAWGRLSAARDSTVAGVFWTRVKATMPADFYDREAASPRFQFVAQITASLQEVA